CAPPASPARGAHAVVDRPPPGGSGDRLVVLLRGEPLESRCAHDLQPERTPECDREREREEGEQQPDPAVRQTGVHAYGFSRTYVVSCARAGWTPSSLRPSAWIRAAACALESCDA